MKEKGKILRVKTGYNPNSSSMGSIIPMFLYITGAAGMVTVFITSMFQKTDREIKQNSDNTHTISENNE